MKVLLRNILLTLEYRIWICGFLNNSFNVWNMFSTQTAMATKRSSIFFYFYVLIKNMNDNELSETHFSTKFIQKSWLLLFVYVLNFLMTWFFESDHETSTKSVLLAFDWLLRWQPDQSEKQNKSNNETNEQGPETNQLLSNKIDFKVFHRKRRRRRLFENVSCSEI